MINDLDGDVAQQKSSEIDGETTRLRGRPHQGRRPEKLVKTAIDAWGKLDIVVNNAGYTLDGALHKMTTRTGSGCSTSISPCRSR